MPMDKDILDRYNSELGATRYTTKFKRNLTERVNNWNEQRLLRRVLRTIADGKRLELALDLPCGYGRIYPILREFAEQVVEGDWSSHLLRIAQEYQKKDGQHHPATGYVRATALAMPFPDGAFDLVLSIRLCHHIREYAERLQYVQEILRISKQWAVFTYFDFHSVKNQLREFRRRFINKSAKWTLRASDIQKLADEAGFDIIRLIPLSYFFSGHRYAVLRRRDHD
jgi:ubiquinone/menaquinone biosynthesis C-methylase UbiE